jgi:hypothetical protein
VGTPNPDPINQRKVCVISVNIHHKDKGYLKEEYNGKIGNYSCLINFQEAMLQKQKVINCIE